LKQIDSRILIEELETDGHSPLKFICSDGAVYYVKYRSGKSFDKKEIHCLVFEMICTRLLQRLHIPVPEHALVVISTGSYEQRQIRINKRYLKPGVIGWGSKEVEQTDLVKEIEQIQKRKEFNKLLNPDDLIRIAIFDLWVDNVDRHSGNYNLLVKLEDGKMKIITIDHAFTFGGLKGMNIFNITTQPNSQRKLIESQYFRSIVKHFRKNERLEIANQFLSLIPELDIENIVNEVFTQIPKDWGVEPGLKNRITEFLQSKQRHLAIQQICKKYLQKNFRRKKP
jgi:CotH kinase protein